MLKQITLWFDILRLNVFKPQKNPYLIVIQINTDFYAIINPRINKGLRIINQAQYAVFEQVDGKTSKVFKTFEIIKTLKLLNSNDSINLSGKFYPSNFEIPHVKTLDLWIHTTDNCNLRCSYCYIKTKIDSTSMNVETIEQLRKKLLETAKKNGLRAIHLRLSGGEPFLNWLQWVDFIRYTRNELQKLDCRFSVAMLSNLTILNPELLQFLKQEKISISVSLDGIGIYNDQTRFYQGGKGTFSDIEKNINTLIEHQIPVGVLIVLSNTNIDGLVKFTKYLVRRKLFFRYNIVNGENIDIEKTIEILKQCYQIMENEIENGFSVMRFHKFGELKFNQLANQNCGSGRSSGAVYTNGEVYFCQKQFGSEKNVGSIFDETDLLETIQKGSELQNSISQECEACLYRFNCNAGCPLERINGKSPLCEIYKIVIPTFYRLLAKEILQSKFHKLKSL